MGITQILTRTYYLIVSLVKLKPRAQWSQGQEARHEFYFFLGCLMKTLSCSRNTAECLNRLIAAPFTIISNGFVLCWLRGAAQDSNHTLATTSFGFFKILFTGPTLPPDMYFCQLFGVQIVSMRGTNSHKLVQIGEERKSLWLLW